MYNKYKYYQYVDEKGRQVVVAVSHFAGRTVKGYAKCDPSDTFDLEKGKALAAARCNYKVLTKKAARAKDNLAHYAYLLAKAKTNADKADQMLCDANIELLQAKQHLSDVLSNLEF